MSGPGGTPRIIGDRYEVVELLGSGASGQTLLCTDRREGSQVAIKELHFAHLEDWKHLELFEREADVLSRIDHPGIPKVLEFFRGDDEATTLYIVQEFVKGASLAERMDGGPMLGQEEVLDIALGLLDVLEYLHGRVPPVLHRDIKPPNVLIRPSGEVVLVDFGGVWAGWRAPGQVGATVVGTFGYMPPEQLIGQAAPTSDLYALGATLLHVLTGKDPGDFPFDSGRIEVPRALPADARLQRLIEALLRPAPRDRPQTAADARQILAGSDASGAVGAITEAGSPDQQVGAALPSVRHPPHLTRRTLSVPAGYGPRFVEMGPPPRHTKGEFADVYTNLVNPLFPARRSWGDGAHLAWLGLATFSCFITFGILPVVYLATMRSRIRDYRPLFEEGEFTRGVILSVDKGQTYATFKYEFEANDEIYVALMVYAQEMTRFWNTSDVVPVLYDREDPGRSCFVYR